MTEHCLLVTDDSNRARALGDCVTSLARHPVVEVCNPAQLADVDSRSFDVAVIALRHKRKQTIRLLFQLAHRSATLSLAACLPTDKLRLRHAALDAGALEIIDWPLDPQLCRIRLQQLFELSRQARLLERLKSRIMYRRRAAWNDVFELENELFRRLANVSAFNDPITHKHQHRTAQLAGRIALELALPQAEADEIERATYLHDIGKIGIPTDVLCKVGQFNSRDRQIMSRHPLIGHEILSDSDTPIMQLGAVIALSHHERFDGSGYPYGRMGSEIPLAGRIAAVADIFDSITEHRRYNRTRSASFAFEQIDRACLEGQLDPDCVGALKAVTCRDRGQV